MHIHAVSFAAMRAVLLSLLLFACLDTFAQAQPVFLFTGDSIGLQSPDLWQFAPGDDPNYAATSFDDHALLKVDPASFLSDRKDTLTHFKGIGWLRLHFRVDSALAGTPLAIGMAQNGACEVYLDGRKIYERGKVGDAKNSIYYDPNYFPFTFAVSDTAPHLLAVRYANWNYNNHNYLYDGESPGFHITIKKADDAFSNYVSSNDTTAVICCILFAIFGSLALIHLLFFLYYRAERSNLWFSLFCGSFSLLFLAPYLGRTLSSPKLGLIIGYYVFFIAVLTCYALSGFLNKLFSRRPRRFTILSITYLIIALCYVFLTNLHEYLIFILLTVAIVGALKVLLTALIRKVPGARIIGAGLGLFMLLLLSIICVAIFKQQIQFNITGAKGLVVVMVIGVAILSIPVSLSAYLARGFSVVSNDLKQRLQQVEELSHKALEQEAEKQRMLAQQNEMLEQQVATRTTEVVRQKSELEAQHSALMEEKQKSDKLLLNILPAEVAEELKQKGSSEARLYEEVSVLFTDFVDFTGMAMERSPQLLVEELNECFTAFDAIIDRNQLEKIKTIGDAYLAVCGLPASDPRHATHTVHAALEIRDFIEARYAMRSGINKSLQIRIGVHSGPVVAGIIGVKKFAYDIWGDTVNMAARMEQTSEQGRINISQATYELVKDEYRCIYRGRVAAKNKGELEMYFVESAFPPPSG